MINTQTIRRWAPWAGAVATGLLLAASFPPLEWKDAAWVALVPIMLSAGGLSSRRAFRFGFLAGAVFWILSISWLIHVTAAGWIVLALYCALYLGVFNLLVSAWLRRFGVSGWLANLGLMAVASAGWAGLEFLRSTLFTGFPWSPLGASQYRNLAVIQLAKWGGVYIVSALVVWVNTGITLTMLRYASGWAGPPAGPRPTRRVGPTKAVLWSHPHVELFIGVIVVALAAVQGWRALREPTPATQPLRVTLIQPNIPQEDKWTIDTVDMIYQRLAELTGCALRSGKADLIIWPETAVPDDIRNSVPSYTLVLDLVTNGTPLLMGSMDTQWADYNEPRYYNSAFLFDTNGVIVQGYDKRHLVIFGEYIPLQPFFPFVKALTPIEASFSKGSTSSVFRLERPPVAFSVLICFEDTLAYLGRESVRNGARLLINLTNDAWFDPSSASRQQFIQCVFRCVENGVPAIRSTNTGVSGCIDRTGRAYDVLEDERGNVIFAGFRSSAVDVPGADMPLTFYTLHGDWFAEACAFIALGGFVLALRKPRG